MISAVCKPEMVAGKATTNVPVEWLQLDSKNPRLAGGASTDEEIVEQLYRSEDPGELLESIAANGYMNIDPLAVCT